MSDEKIIIGITQGDVNGIGLEVILKTFLDPQMMELFTPVIFGSQKTASYHRKALNIEDFSFNIIRDVNEANPKRANLINVYDEEINIELGMQTNIGGKYAFKSLEAATQALQQNKIDALVTAPINKQNIQSETFHFPGHTEYLDDMFGKGNSLMILMNDKLKVALVTGHTPLNKVADELSIEKILKKLHILNQSLIQDFSIRKPKIAVLGLNPHASDNGLIGNEEQNIITPAINKAKEENIMAYGPYAADGFFGKGSYNDFDAVLAMYHDQGLVGFKALAFGNGVNYTAGLPIVRTSPDHGTAYDIAGKGLANEQSFRNALYAAIDIYKNRKIHAQISGNPLKINPIRKER